MYKDGFNSTIKVWGYKTQKINIKSEEQEV